MSSSLPKLRLPQIDRVALQSFSLYAANPDAQFSCGTGVLCLVGANGIGKSTLLSAINFCLTGIVSEPNRNFKSMDEYYRHSRDFSSRYFRGRIRSTEEDDAEIELTFGLGDSIYEVTRGLFEPEELRKFRILNKNSSSVLLETDDLTRAERHRAYMARLVQESGVASFEEFVFLQHFVFTFDEQRRTLFWSQDILEIALYRAFGMKADMAKQADLYRREVEKEDSNVRNRQWEATRLRRRVNELLAQTQASAGVQEKFDTLTEDHRSLTAQFDEEIKNLNAVESAIKDANLKLADLSVKETALRDEYSSYFERQFEQRPPLSQHPFIAQSLADHSCGLCGNTSEAAISKLRERINAHACPLCESEIQPQPIDLDTTRLKEIDKQLAEYKAGLREVLSSIGKLRDEEQKARTRYDDTKSALDRFDEQNSALLSTLRHKLNTTEGAASIDLYREQLAKLEEEKAEAYAKRESFKKQLLNLQKELELQYLEAEETFVPRFAELATRFLGIPLTVQLDARQASGLNMIVNVGGDTRRQQQQLSESQRFFLDIALRMALTEQMSAPGSLGGMYIDTPEGSLDIAYEKRAGDMLAMFAAAGHRIIMTANLNSSQLLLALARNCGRTGMELCRMMDWSDLTEVQRSEEGLFESAYSQIIEAMTPLPIQ